MKKLVKKKNAVASPQIAFDFSNNVKVVSKNKNDNIKRDNIIVFNPRIEIYKKILESLHKN